MNQKTVLLCIALASCPYIICMERQNLKRSLEGIEQRELSVEKEDTGQKAARTAEESALDDFFIQQISQQMGALELTEDGDDSSGGAHDNNAKRGRGSERHLQNAARVKKNKEQEASKEEHLLDRQALLKDLKTEIFKQLDDLNKAIENHQGHGPLNLFDQYLATVDHLLKIHENFIPGYVQKYGYTAFHIAAKLGHLPVVKFLVEKCNTDPSLQTAHGRTALDFAEDSKQTQVVDYLFPLIFDWLEL